MNKNDQDAAVFAYCCNHEDYKTGADAAAASAPVVYNHDNSINARATKHMRLQYMKKYIRGSRILETHTVHVHNRSTYPFCDDSNSIRVHAGYIATSPAYVTYTFTKK